MKQTNVPGWETFSIPLELNALDETEGIIKGYASVFGSKVDAWIPSVLHAGAFKKTIKERFSRIKILNGHDLNDPIGVPTLLEERSKGLYFEAKLTLTNRVRELLMLIKDNVIDSVSIGFDAIKWSMVEEDKETVRHIQEVRLWEISTVLWGADPNALITEAHSVTGYQDLPLAGRHHPWDRTAAEERVRAWAEADDEPNATYRRAFLWVNSEAPDTFSSFRFQIADVVDGALHVIPRAVFAAAAACQASRGGLSVPESDVPRIRAHLSRYYRKLAQAEKDDTIVAPWDAEVESLAWPVEQLMIDPPLIQWAMSRLQCREALTPAELERAQAAQALWRDARDAFESRLMRPLAPQADVSEDEAMSPELEPANESESALSRIAEMEALAAAYAARS